MSLGIAALLTAGVLSGEETPADQPADRILDAVIAEVAAGRMAGTPVVALLDRARVEGPRHRAEYHRPISSETPRRRTGVGAKRSRELVALVRAEMLVGDDLATPPRELTVDLTETAIVTQLKRRSEPPAPTGHQRPASTDRRKKKCVSARSRRLSRVTT